MNRELGQKTKDINRLMEDSKVAYEERDRLAHQIARVNEMAKREAKNFEDELSELAFAEEKNHRNFAKMAAISEPPRVTPDPVRADQSFAESTNLERNQAIEKQTRLQLDSAKLKVATGVSNAPLNGGQGVGVPLAAKKVYEACEEKNFGDFKLVLGLANDAEELEVQINELKRSLEAQQTLSDEAKDKRNFSLKDSNRQLEHGRKSLEELQNKQRNVDSELASLIFVIRCIWEKFGIPPEEFDSHSTEAVLQLLEQKLNAGLLQISMMSTRKIDPNIHEVDLDRAELDAKVIHELFAAQSNEEAENKHPNRLTVEEMRLTAKLKLAKFNPKLKAKKPK